MAPPTATPGRASAALPPGFRHLTVAHGIRAAMRRAPDKVALRFGDRQRSYTALVARMDRLANAARGLGLKPGDHAALIARNSLDYVEIVCGLPQAGVAVATVNPRLSAEEMRDICDDARARIVIADAASAELVRDLKFETVERVIELGDPYEELLARASDRVPTVAVDEWAPWTIPYTSGTTGRPKGVLISHRSRALTLFGMAGEYGCYSPEDSFLAIAPMNHGAGIVFPLGALFFGGTAEIMDRFDPDAVLARLHDGRHTGIFMVPTHFHGLFELDARTLDARRDLALKTIISNAAPLPQPTKERAVDYFGAGILHETYGSTEAGIVTNLRPPDQLRKQRCVGQPFVDTLVELRGPDGAECAPGEVGELFSLSPYLFNGYWQRPEETERALEHGWVTVGDMAVRDEEGYIYIVDRKKDMVISGGVNIYPREIEEVLLTHPAVADAAVIGVPDDKWGERLKAFLVLRPGAQADAADILSVCDGRLAGYKKPKDTAILDVLPRNANGKVLKTELRQM